MPDGLSPFSSLRTVLCYSQSLYMYVSHGMYVGLPLTLLTYLRTHINRMRTLYASKLGEFPANGPAQYDQRGCCGSASICWQKEQNKRQANVLSPHVCRILRWGSLNMGIPLHHTHLKCPVKQIAPYLLGLCSALISISSCPGVMTQMCRPPIPKALV
ncbi:hypothetical protein BX600DRAFT_465551 [Xylariales sp. PMI_506]|nr:hypothetical protein BX600DRAFT_465551 [Xylariales sp. PMI_506]